jgi:selenium metabolism protein YedF
MKTIDCCGMTCPLPVIETKNALEKQELNEICVVVDNLVSSENVMRFLQSQGFTVTAMKVDDTYRIEGTKTGEFTEPLPADGPIAQVSAKKILVFIDGETVGRGSEELGAILMRSFLYTLKELNPLPWRIIFINSGVKLAVEGSPLLTALGELADLGLEIISCGTCLDYYQIKDKLMVGKISNMYEIVSSFLEATNVIKP